MTGDSSGRHVELKEITALLQTTCVANDLLAVAPAAKAVVAVAVIAAVTGVAAVIPAAAAAAAVLPAESLGPVALHSVHVPGSMLACSGRCLLRQAFDW